MDIVREGTWIVSAGIVAVACSSGSASSEGAGLYIAHDGGSPGPAPTASDGVAPAPSAAPVAASIEGGAPEGAVEGDSGTESDATATSATTSDGSVADSAQAVAPAPPAATVATPAAPAVTVAPAAVAAAPAAVGSTGGAPTIGGCQIFPSDNPWNTRIDDPQAYPVHPNSATYIASMSPNTHLHPDWGDWSSSMYGIPWETVPASQPMVPMTFDVSDESDPGPYPFPANARVEGGAGSGGDMHVIVLDTGTCTLYETYSSTYVGPGWSCSSGAKFDLTSNALRPDGWTSADAAGLPVLPGLVRVSEVQAGAIHHALRFTVSSTQQGYIHPATHAAGSHDTSLPPMGLRIRLKASFDVSKFTGPAAVILTAMQQYGLILADNGSNWFVSGDSDDGWIPLMDGVSSAFSQVIGNDFEAVQTGPIQQ
jgi:hypothetical protein